MPNDNAINFDMMNNAVPHHPETWPFRYMTTKVPIEVHDWNGNHPVDANTTTRILPIGTTVKVVMVSRMGDIGITDNLTAENGYNARTDINTLSDRFENPRNNP